MTKKSKTERALRATVNEGRIALRELERAREEIEKKIMTVAVTIKVAEGVLTDRGLPIPGHPGRRPKAVATPSAVVAHVATQAQVATEQFDAPKAKGGSYKRTAAQKRAVSLRMKALWAERRAAAQASAHA